MHVREKEKPSAGRSPTFSPAGWSSVSGVCVRQKGNDARMLPSFSCVCSLLSHLCEPRERLKDSGSTFGRCSEYVGLCSLSEPLDSCRETPTASRRPPDIKAEATWGHLSSCFLCSSTLRNPYTDRKTFRKSQDFVREDLFLLGKV